MQSTVTVVTPAMIFMVASESCRLCSMSGLSDDAASDGDVALIGMRTIRRDEDALPPLGRCLTRVSCGDQCRFGAHIGGSEACG